jgi:hypothetical protein
MPKMKTHSSLKGRFKITGTICYPLNPIVKNAFWELTPLWLLAM